MLRENTKERGSSTHPQGWETAPWKGHTHGSLNGREFAEVCYQMNLQETCPLKFLGKLFMERCLVKDIALQNHPRDHREGCWPLCCWLLCAARACWGSRVDPGRSVPSSCSVSPGPSTDQAACSLMPTLKGPKELWFYIWRFSLKTIFYFLLIWLSVVLLPWLHSWPSKT